MINCAIIPQLWSCVFSTVLCTASPFISILPWCSEDELCILCLCGVVMINCAIIPQLWSCVFSSYIRLYYLSKINTSKIQICDLHVIFSVVQIYVKPERRLTCMVDVVHVLMALIAGCRINTVYNVRTAQLPGSQQALISQNVSNVCIPTKHHTSTKYCLMLGQRRGRSITI